jgi:hypothetical protein
VDVSCQAAKLRTPQCNLGQVFVQDEETDRQGESLMKARMIRTITIAKRTAATTLLAVAFGGCAFGQKIAYHAGDTAAINASGTNSVAVAAYDQRPGTVKGGDPTYVGVLRSLGGIPYPVNTASGQPLANDFAAMLSGALAARGFQATSIVVAPQESWANIERKLKASRADRGVVLTIEQWLTDTYFTTQLDYSLTLRVLDQDGRLLAEQQVAGTDKLEQTSPIDAFRQKITALVTPDVSRALIPSQTADTPPPPTPAPATAAAPKPGDSTAAPLQRLKDLRDQGLITEDVYKEKMREILNKL